MATTTTTPDGSSNNNNDSNKEKQQTPEEALAAARARVEKSVADRTVPKKPARTTVCKTSYTPSAKYALGSTFGFWLFAICAVISFIVAFSLSVGATSESNKEQLCDLIVYDYDADEYAYVDVFPVLSGQRAVDSSPRAWYSHRNHVLRIYSKFNTPPKIGSASSNGKISCYGEIPDAFGACYISSPSQQKSEKTAVWVFMGILVLMAALGYALHLSSVYSDLYTEQKSIVDLLAERDDFLRHFGHVPHTATYNEITSFLRDPSVVAAAEAKCAANHKKQ